MLAQMNNHTANFHLTKCIIDFTAIGCPNLVPPQHSWLQRDGNQLVVGCENTDQQWHLSCEDNHWLGVIGNCTQCKKLYTIILNLEKMF